MSTSCTPCFVDDRQRLIAYALDSFDPAMAVHVASCATCRAEVRLLRSLTESLRAKLTCPPGEVQLLTCQKFEASTGFRCVAVDESLGMQIIVNRANGSLMGQVIGCSETCTCWQDAIVRLFGGSGYVASCPVDANGCFHLPSLMPNQRYSLGLVLTGEHGPQLRIVGEVES